MLGAEDNNRHLTEDRKHFSKFSQYVLDGPRLASYTVEISVGVLVTLSAIVVII